MIAAVCAVLAIISAAGAYAFFSSQRTATGNQFQTGSLQLQVGAAIGDPITESIDVPDLYPGDGSTSTPLQAMAPNSGWPILYTKGAKNADLRIGVTLIENLENECLPDEIMAGDSDTGEFAERGELAQNVSLFFWIDKDNNGVWGPLSTSGDIGFYPSTDPYIDSQHQGDGGDGVHWSVVTTANSATIDPNWFKPIQVYHDYTTSTANLLCEVVSNIEKPTGGNPTEIGKFYCSYYLPDAGNNGDNAMQSDGLGFDLTFELTNVQ